MNKSWSTFLVENKKYCCNFICITSSFLSLIHPPARPWSNKCTFISVWFNIKDWEVDPASEIVIRTADRRFHHLHISLYVNITPCSIESSPRRTGLTIIHSVAEMKQISRMISAYHISVMWNKVHVTLL